MPKKSTVSTKGFTANTDAMAARFCSRAGLEVLAENGSKAAAVQAIINCLPEVTNLRTMRRYMVCVVEVVSLGLMDARTATALMKRAQVSPSKKDGRWTGPVM